MPFFILPAFNKRSLLNIFSTHPALDKRIEALQRLEIEMGGRRR